MAVVIDRESRTVSLSVGDLLQEEVAYRIGFSGTATLKRMWVGQGIHISYQEEQMAARHTYRREVPVSHTFSHMGYRVTLHGRIDGMFRERDRTIIIEEVKSLHFGRDLDRFIRGELGENYRRQVSLYAWLWSSASKENAAARLVLIDVTTGEQKTEEVKYESDRVKAFAKNRVARILKAHEKAEESRRRKREKASKLTFPHDAYRPFQKEMCEEITRALSDRRHLLIDAPTGVGKTAAALFPAIRFAMERDLKIFYLTAKTLQQEMAVTTIKRMNRGGMFRSMQLRAKSRMCANSEIICHEDYCRFARDYGEKLRSNATHEKLLEAFPHLDPDAVYSAAVTDEVCPFEVSLELTRHVDVVVCDYNYIFEPRVSLKDTREGMGLADAVLVVDEAHNLVDRGREYYSPALDTAMISAARAHLTLLSGDLFDLMGTLLGNLEEDLKALTSKSLDEHGGETVLEQGPAWLFDHLKDLESIVLDYITHQHEKGLRRREDPLLDLFFVLTRMVFLLTDEGPELKWILRKHKNNITLKVQCLDPSRFLGEIIGQTWSTIAMSATLKPFEFYETLMGFPRGETDREEFPSPFPRENRLLMVIPTLSTTYRKRARTVAPLAKLLHNLGNAASGNFLVLLPSYAYLNLVLSVWPEGGKKALVQHDHLSPDERMNIIRSMNDPERDYLLFAVSGGMYAEGLDYPGEMLGGAFIVSPSLPQIGLEQKLLMAYYQERYERGFSYAYLIPGMRRVIQAAGRVIRSEQDRGVIALICERFSDTRYSRYFPSYWYDHSPEELITKNPLTLMRKFMEARDET